MFNFNPPFSIEMFFFLNQKLAIQKYAKSVDAICTIISKLNFTGSYVGFIIKIDLKTLLPVKKDRSCLV